MTLPDSLPQNMIPPLETAVRLCRDCDLQKPLDAFGYKTVRGTRYRESYCKPCKALRSKAWRQRQRKDENDPTTT